MLKLKNNLFFLTQNWNKLDFSTFPQLTFTLTFSWSNGQVIVPWETSRPLAYKYPHYYLHPLSGTTLWAPLQTVNFQFIPQERIWGSSWLLPRLTVRFCLNRISPRLHRYHPILFILYSSPILCVRRNVLHFLQYSVHVLLDHFSSRNKRIHPFLKKL